MNIHIQNSNILDFSSGPDFKIFIDQEPSYKAYASDIDPKPVTGKWKELKYRWPKI